MPQTLKIAVCLFKGVTTLDYLGSMELLGFLAPNPLPPFSESVAVNITYLANTKEAVEPGSGPRFIPDATFEDAKRSEQFDILFVPGGTRSLFVFIRTVVLIMQQGLQPRLRRSPKN